MKKKTRATASGAAKRPKSGASGRKTAPRRTPAAEPLPAASSDDAKATIRRLKAQLARTQARIEELQASADTDFLLDIPNRRGFERELQREIAYIQRYRAGVAILDIHSEAGRALEAADSAMYLRKALRRHELS